MYAMLPGEVDQFELERYRLFLLVDELFLVSRTIFGSDLDVLKLLIVCSLINYNVYDY